MRNHDQKRRDMARSVLPSTRRGPRLQRDRRAIHQRVRTAEREVLHPARTLDDLDSFDDFVDVPAASLIAEFVYDRRRGDKVGPLIRWATRIVETDPRLRHATLDERLAHFRRLLPDNLVGRHALFHLRWDLDPDQVARRRYWSRAACAEREAARVDAIRVALGRIVAAGALGRLNGALKAEFPAGDAVENGRLQFVSNAEYRFHGGPDVDRFTVLAAKSREVASIVLSVAEPLDPLTRTATVSSR